VGESEDTSCSGKGLPPLATMLLFAACCGMEVGESEDTSCSGKGLPPLATMLCDNF